MRALIADVLTATRAVLAVFLAVTLASGSFPIAIVVLVIAWATDLLDGRLARAAEEDTRLGDWDFRIDVSLGIAILVGLTLSGLASMWVVIAVVATLGGFTLVSGNPAPAMLLLAFAYALFLWLLLDLQPGLWWLPFASIVVLLVVDWRRFFKVILPAFFRGLATLGRSDSPEGGPVLDRWA